MRRLLLLVASLLCATATAQQTWKVCCSGAYGANFTNLQAAVNAAAPGDIIWAYSSPTACAGNTVGLSGASITKPLHLVGFKTNGVPGTASPTTVGIAGPLVISGIPAGTMLTLSNVAQIFGSPPSGITLSNCAGKVLLEDYHLESVGNTGYSLTITNCADVTFRGCSIGLGGSPITITDSDVTFTSCGVDYWAPFPGTGAYTQTTESIRAVRSRIQVHGSGIRGAGELQPGIPTLGAKPAFTLNDSQLIIGGFSDVRGGAFVTSGHGQPWAPPAGGSVGNSTVVLDPRAYIQGSPTLAQPTYVGAFVDSTYHNWVIADENYIVSSTGPQNGFAMLLFGDLLQSPLPTPYGNCHLDPDNIQVVDIVSIPGTLANSGHSWTFHCPPSAPNGVPFVFQAVTLTPNLDLQLTAPTPLTVAWQHGRTP